MGKQFRLDHEATIGTEFAARMINIQDTVIKLQIWDTAGLESFQALTTSYYRGASAALLVYDVSQRTTFNSLPFWLNQARSYARPDLIIMLVGNKADLDYRQVQFQEGCAFAQQHGLIFIEASAKTGQNVEEAFLQTSRIVFKGVSDQVYDLGPSSSVKSLRIDRQHSMGDPACVNLSAEGCACIK